LQLLVTDVGKV